MITKEFLALLLFLSVILAAILFLLLGQITVRKLRKNPITKSKLGPAYVRSWEVINVAQALVLPRFLVDKLEKSRVSNFYADARLLREHTNAFDRFLGVSFFLLWSATGLSLIVWGILEAYGFL